jgi:hypothetical protein
MMNKEQLEYVKQQLDIMAEEVEAIKDVADRAEVRGQYIQLFIDMCAVSNQAGAVCVNPSDALLNDKAKVQEPVEEELVEEEVLEEEEEVVEEPPHVTAETEAVLPEQEEEDALEEEDPLGDAEIVKVVLNDDDEEVDITEIYSILVKDGVAEEDAEMVGLFVTEYDSVEAYVNRFNYMQHGLGRAYAAYLATSLEDADLIAHIENFSSVKVASPEEFIDDENAEALFDFICQ